MSELDDAGAQWVAARSYADAARETVRELVLNEWRRRAPERGLEAELARRSGAERQAVREWVGLRKRPGRATRARVGRDSEPFEEAP